MIVKSTEFPGVRLLRTPTGTLIVTAAVDPSRPQRGNVREAGSTKERPARARAFGHLVYRGVNKMYGSIFADDIKYTLSARRT
jgi:hypothetical protein